MFLKTLFKKKKYPSLLVLEHMTLLEQTSQFTAKPEKRFWVTLGPNGKLLPNGIGQPPFFLFGVIQLTHIFAFCKIKSYEVGNDS